MKPTAIVAVLVSIVAALVMVGSPSEARVRKLDERRVGDLQRLVSAVDLFHSRHGALPQSAAAAMQEVGSAGDPLDPVTGQPYPYRVTGADTYEVCADFQRGGEADGQLGIVGFWSHLSGHQCFARTSGKVRY